MLPDRVKFKPPAGFQFTDLPAAYRPENEQVFAEATGEMEMAFAKAWTDRRTAAIAAVAKFSAEIGSRGCFEPFHTNEPSPAFLFAFDEKPTGREWKVAKPRARDTFYKAHPSKTPEGEALRARMEALPPFPSNAEITDFARVPSNISYSYGQCYGGCGLAPSSSVAKLAWVEGRHFIYFANPYTTLSHLLADHEDLEADFGRPEMGSPYEWRLGEGWTTRTKAEIDLIFAQAAVNAERTATA